MRLEGIYVNENAGRIHPSAFRLLSNCFDAVPVHDSGAEVAAALAKVFHATGINVAKKVARPRAERTHRKAGRT